MKTFKMCITRALFILLTITYIVLACSCSAGDSFDDTTMSTSFSSDEICNYDEASSEEDSSCETTEQTANGISPVVINSLTEKVLHLKINTKEDQLSSFVDLIKSNPIDSVFDKDTVGIDNANELWDLIEHKYIPILMIEINQAVDDLSLLVGDDFGELIGGYVASCTDTAEKRLACETQLFANGNSGIYLGQYVYFGIYNTYFDAYRQLLFNLRYWTYIVETENNGAPNKSLKFIYDSDANGDSNIVLLYCDNIIIDTRLSPSYTKDDAIDFISEQKERITYCSDEERIALLTESYTKAIKDMTNDAIHQTVLTYCESYAERINKEVEIYGCLKNSVDLTLMRQKDKFHLSSVIGYWAFIIEQEAGTL